MKSTLARFVYISSDNQAKAQAFAERVRRETGDIVISTWHDTDRVSANNNDTVKGKVSPNDPRWAARAARNGQLISQAHTYILLAADLDPSSSSGHLKVTGGKFVEFGLAVALKEIGPRVDRIVVVGGRENGMVSYPGVHHVETVDDAIALIAADEVSGPTE